MKCSFCGNEKFKIGAIVSGTAGLLHSIDYKQKIKVFHSVYLNCDVCTICGTIVRIYVKEGYLQKFLDN